MKKGMIITAAIVVVGLCFSEGVIAKNTTNAMIVAQDDVKYNEVETTDLPEQVSTSIKEGYGDYTVSKAFKGDDGTYKAKLEKNDEKISVFFNEQGEFLKIEQGDDKSWKSDKDSKDDGLLQDNNTTDPMNDTPINDGTGTDGGTTDPLTP